MESVIFLSKSINLSQLNCKKFSVKRRPESSQNFFSKVIFSARELIFTFNELMANPHGDIETIIVVGPKSLFHHQKFKSKCEKLGLIPGKDMECSSGIIQSCINYTFLAKLAPGWNRVGSWLIRGRQFLHQVEPLPAIKMTPRLTGTEIEIEVKATNYRFPLLQPSELNIDTEIFQNFMLGDENEVIPSECIKNKAVLVLPNLTRGRLMSVTKKLPENSNFKNFSQMKRYWKNMYGYRLTDNEDSLPVVYYNVSFGQKTVFTYPEWTVRSADPMKIPRSDPRPIISDFVNDLQRKIGTVFGSPFDLNSKQASQPVVDVQVANSLDTTLGSISRPCLRPGFPTPSHPYRVQPEINATKKVHNLTWEQVTNSPACNNSTVKIASSGDSGYCSEQTPSQLEIQSPLDKEVPYLNESTKIKPHFNRKVNTISSANQPVKNSNDFSSNVTLASPIEKIDHVPSFSNKLLNRIENNSNSIVPHFSTKTSIPRSGQDSIDSLAGKKICESVLTSQINIDAPKENKKPTVTPRFPVNNFISRFQTLSEKLNPPSIKKDIKLPSTIMFPSSISSGLVFKKPEDYLTPITSKPASPLTVGTKRKPSVQDVDITTIIKEKGASGLAKVNTTTLLHYLRKEGVQGIKAKSRKDELVRAALQHNGILPNVI